MTVQLRAQETKLFIDPKSYSYIHDITLPAGSAVNM